MNQFSNLPTLRQWISRSVFLESQKRTDLLEKLETIPQESLERLFKSFEAADQHQHDLLVKTLKDRPGFWEEFQQIVRGGQKDALVRKEASSIETDQAILSALEKEIAEIIPTNK